MSRSTREYLQHILDETHYDWRAMAAMRDRLIHSYFGVDYDIVWDVVVRHIPHLNAEVLVILSQEHS